MAKSRKQEELIQALNQIRPDPTSEMGLVTLHQILTSRYAIAVALAARLIGDAEIHGLIPDLVQAFERFMIHAATTDPGCRAKQSIAEALYRLHYSNTDLFLQGIRHVQLEPTWGGQVDTAPRLRGTCALGLVRMNYTTVMVELADLLADAEPEARIGAARAIAYSGDAQGVPLLRLRIKVGDTAPVLSECLVALLKLAPLESLPLAKQVLYTHNATDPTAHEIAEAAALALGESRLPQVFPILREWWLGVKDVELRQTGLLAIATLRQDDAFDFLLSLIADGNVDEANQAIAALEIFQQDTALWQRVCDTVIQRSDPALITRVNLPRQ